MDTTYHPYKIALTDGQNKKLQKAYVSKTAVALRVRPEQIGRGDELLLTATQISRVKKQRRHERNKGTNFRQHFENVHRRGSSKRKHHKELFLIRYTKMEVYCVKEKRHNPM